VFGGKSEKQRDVHWANLMDNGFIEAAEYARPILPASHS
jgi:hypothetical protein